MRLIAAYRWELWLLVGGVSCFYPVQAVTKRPASALIWPHRLSGSPE